MISPKFFKISLVLTILFGLACIACGIFEYMIPLYYSFKYNVHVKGNAQSYISIIGGADGPTVVNVHNGPSNVPLTLIFLAITILGIGYQIYIKKMSKKTMD